MKRLLVAALLLALPAAGGEAEVRLLTDEAIPRYLDRGRELALAGQWDRMVDVLQRVIAGDPEIFPDLEPEVLHAAVHSRDGVLFYPARELCIEELAKLPPEGLAAYRAAYDAAARDLLARADAVPEVEARLDAYSRVYELYLVSTVGDDALERAADLSLSLGRYGQALSLLRRLLDLYPADGDRDLAMARAKAAYCAARIGAREMRERELERLAADHGQARILVEGKSVPASELATHPALRLRGETPAGGTEWPVAGGNPARARVSEDLPDELPREPFWSFRLAERDARLEATYDLWRVYLHDRDGSVQPRVEDPDLHHDLAQPYPAVRPVVHGGAVLYKDGVTFVGRSLGSGALVLHRDYYVPPDPNSRDASYLVPAGKVRPGTGDSKLGAARETAYRFLDYGMGSVVAEGRFVVCTEAEEGAAPEHLRPMGNEPRVPPAPPANGLGVYDRWTGKTLWLRGRLGDYAPQDPDARAEWSRDYELHPQPAFRGPGVVDGGVLYTIVEEGLEEWSVALWALDLRTARVIFRTHLHFADASPQKHVLPRGGSVAVAGGVVYAATGAGVVAAVDALPPGRVRWIRRYPRNVGAQPVPLGGPRNRPRPAAVVHQGFAYGDPVVAGGKVIVAPVDGTDLLALDAESGRLAWGVRQRDLGDVAYVAGVSDGVVVLAGAEVVGLDLATGTVLWRSAGRLSHWIFGRGAVGKRYAYVPTNDGSRKSQVHCFEVAGTGDGPGRTRAPARTYEFDVDRLGNLVIAGGRLLAASDDRILCFTTLERELADVDARMAASGESAELLVERALVSLRAPGGPRRDEARTDLSRAIARAGPATAPARIHAIENLLAMARERGDAAPLEEARTLARGLTLSDGRPVERSPYLAQIALLELEIHAREGRFDVTLDALERFLGEHGRDEVVVDGKVTSGDAAAGTLRAALDRDPKFREALAARVRAAIRAAVEAGDAAALQALPARYGMEPPVEDSFLALADLHGKAGDAGLAEQALRRLIGIAVFETRPARAEAHLRLAAILAERGMLAEAQAQRDHGVSRLDEEGRRRHAALLESLDRLLSGVGAPSPLPELKLPLWLPQPVDGAAPVPIGGDVPAALADLLLVADSEGYAAYDAQGNRLWRTPHAARERLPAGPVDDPRTATAAAAVAAARFARALGEDLLIGDVYGLTRLNARSGEAAWQVPPPREAAAQADACLQTLRRDLEAVQGGERGRRNVLPRYELAGEIVVAMRPLHGIEAYKAATGRLAWSDPDVKGATVGGPQVLGQLLAVGIREPAAVHVLDVASGRTVTPPRAAPRRGDGEPAVLLAPPVLDPFGRLFVVTGTKESGRLDIVGARTDEPALPRTVEVRGPTPFVLHADGRLLVFHDGGEGGANLHFLDLAEDGPTVAVATETLLREVHILRDGGHLFVFTHGDGDRALGARLFRIDLAARSALAYQKPPGMAAYAVPVLTRRFVAVAGSDARLFRVRLHEKEASTPSSPPARVFASSGGLSAEALLEPPPDEPIRYDVPPSLAAAAGSLAVGAPFTTLVPAPPGR